MSPIETVTPPQLIDLGRLLRERRRELGLSIRKLASQSGVSASYIGSLESARNPATGKPAAPSLRTLTPLLESLGLDMDEVLRGIGVGAAATAAHRHALLYVLGSHHTDVLAAVEELVPTGIDHWLYVPDPRSMPSSTVSAERITPLSWPLGQHPYPDDELKPDRILTRLAESLAGAEAALAPHDALGIVIADCSAVMRSVRNPSAEVAFEAEWEEQVAQTFTDSIGREVTANVCVYHHDDIEAMGMQIDTLASVLSLLQQHRLVGLVDRDGDVRTGGAAVRTLLRELRPPGVSTTAWKLLVNAAAQALGSAASVSALDGRVA